MNRNVFLHAFFLIYSMLSAKQDKLDMFEARKYMRRVATYLMMLKNDQFRT